MDIINMGFRPCFRSYFMTKNIIIFTYDIMSCDIFEQYSTVYDPGIPDYIFFFFFWITSTLIAILLLMMKKKAIKETVMGALLAECIFIIFCSTVIYRETLPEPHYKFMPFWSYKAIGEGDDMCFVEVFLNIILFIPVGFLACGLRRMNCFWKVAFLGCIISCTIESLQLWLLRGVCELDDVFHNTLGSIVGYGLYQLIASLFKWNMVKK